ncbi:LuxR C-terminal-related transcriptional regulator [Gordonia tangerina]|uniref:LuxR C-terminal-related transcriptional regulator n=1 Tax=Gordonia tangerina TaxID=2911060 RepID=A0ABS9DEP9_9ACTN|nr:LuxR C-terminal-related transcriptional regulator [Gordonia tangerina]MCF3937102.1 LuxR C-terminal-related transcriptional regulator [Gordonia tangerina]
MDAPSGRLAPGLRLRTARPALPPAYVHRHRIDQTLSACGPGDIAVVEAGAGYGKSLAVASWLQHRVADGPVAWLAVGEPHGMRALWSDILGSLTAGGASTGSGALLDIAPGPAFAEPEVDMIVDGLASSPTPVTLVLDDVHRIDAPDVMDSIRHLVARQPERLRLVLITRAAPDLRLQRVRLEGRLIEVGMRDLQFTRDDVVDLGRMVGSEFDATEVDTLLERTQGWATGLRLAVLSARDDLGHVTSDRLTGRNDLVAAYLLEEVLEDLAPTDRRFLLATSVGESITPSLARELTGRADSRRVLDDLVARNVLTVRLADRPDWYAYHPLFRELLIDRLGAENPDAPADLHRRAANWCVRNDDPIAAIDHFARAGAWHEVTTVLGDVAGPLVLSPQASELAGALESAAREAARRPTADTLLAAAVLCYHRGDFGEMSRNAEDAAELLDAEPARATPGSRILIALTRMVTARSSRLPELIDRCDEVLDLVASASRVEIPAARAYTLMARNNRGIGLFHRGEVDAAATELVGSAATAEDLGLGLTALAAETYLALIDVTRGELGVVADRIAAMTALVERRGWTRQPQAVALYAAQALLDLERHDLDAADRAVSMARRAVGPGTDTAALLIGEAVAVGVAVTRADVYAARAQCRRLEIARRSTSGLPPLVRSWYDVAIAETRILMGEAESVITSLTRPDASATYEGALTRVVLAKAQLAAGRPAVAIDVLGTADGFAPHRLQAVEAEILTAVAWARLHRDVAALQHLTAAVRLAAPVRQIRPFVAGGAPVAALLTRLEHVTAEDPEFVRDLLGVCGRVGTPDSTVVVPPVESLTDRELMVLQYLPTMYKAAEIAADLFVSVNTVKTHQQSIYRKLGVSSRRDAVDRARERHLI